MGEGEGVRRAILLSFHNQKALDLLHACQQIGLLVFDGSDFYHGLGRDRQAKPKAVRCWHQSNG
jgi:hypothetical protein